MAETAGAATANPRRRAGAELARGQLWLLLDVASVLAFVVAGRDAHTKGESVAGIASTSWPFLAGLGAGWLVARAWRRPQAIVPTGLGAWLCCVAIGMVLRVVARQGTAVAFVLVALGFLGLFMLGWRGALAVRPPIPTRSCRAAWRSRRRRPG